MSLDRRTFLQGLGVGAIGALAGAGPLSGAVRPAEKLPDFAAGAEAFWLAVRAHYPLLADPVYLNTGGLGPASQPVLDRVFATMRDLQEHSETGHALLEPARETMSHFLGAQPAEISFVRNATEANSIIAAGLTLAPGDEVIFETHAHPGGSFPWLNQTKQRGVIVRLFEPDPASPEANLARIRALVTPRTKVIQVSHITCTTGLVMPVAAIAALARESGIWFHIDAAQSLGMIPVDLAAIGCDSAAFSGHKWLGGPHETGLLYIRHDRLEAVALTGVGAYSAELPHLPGELHYFGATSRHEYGTRNAGLIAGLAEAVRLQEAIGRDRIAAHGRELATQLLNKLARIDGIAVLTPRHEALRASITTIRHARADAPKLFGYLLNHHQLRCRPVTEQGLNAVRISTHVFTSRAETERVIAGVHAAARDL
jgi:selenocysteine lyase/cysteine desulfurase